jgi:DNA-binding NarL/FixJ family response regulator
MRTNVFIVDDHFMIIEGLRKLLSEIKEVECCGHATNAASCLSFLKQSTPDVILMDINLPDKSGLDLCIEVTKQYPSIRVIGLSTFNQKPYISKMLANGAMGYLLKNATSQEIMMAINTVMKGQQYLCQEASVSLRQILPADNILLSLREKEVLGCIAEGHNSKAIADKLFIAETTVITHRKSLLTKLNAKNTAELIKLAVIHKLITIE